MVPDTQHQLSAQSLAAPGQLSDAERLRHLMTVEVRYPPPPDKAQNAFYGVAIALICTLCFSWLWAGAQNGFELPVTTVVIESIGLMIAGWLALKHWEANTPNAAKVVLKQQKFPITYLRPFRLDQRLSIWYHAISRGDWLGALIAEKFLITPEMRLVKSLQRRLECPVVAVADPNSSPRGHLGALRVWISHEFWQEKVREFIRYAPVVLLAVGETKGSMWELEEVIRSMDSQRLVLLIPRGDRAKLIAALNRALPKPVDELDRKTRFIVFEDDWSPRQANNVDEVLRRFHVVPCIES
jgi:hypothetical protein